MSNNTPDEPEADILPPSPDTPRGGYSASDDDPQEGGYGRGTRGTHEGVTGADPGNLWIRLLFMVGFGILAWLVFSLVIVLAVLQFIVALVNKELNEDLKQFSGRTVIYLADLLGFVTFQSDERPFPFGPFPEVPEEE